MVRNKTAHNIRINRLMSVTPQIWLMRSTFLQSLAPALIKLTHLWFSNDPEDMLRCVWLSLELNSAGKWILWARFEDPWPVWNNRFWKGLFWFEPFNWVAKEWPVNVSILLVAYRAAYTKPAWAQRYKSCSGPTPGHHGINVDSPLVWATHREPAVSPKLRASSG